MAGTMMMQWPSQTWTGYQAEATANQIPARARTPTWPAQLEPPHSNSTHPQPNTFLQLTQVLEWEVWNHDQTRAVLRAEQNRSEDLEGHIWKLEQDIAQWQQACHSISVALDKHRNEHVNLQKDLDGMTDELEHLRRLQPESQAIITHETSTADADGSPKAEQLDEEVTVLGGEVRGSSGEAESDGAGAGSWRLGFIREIEDHLR